MHWIDFQEEPKRHTESADLGTDAAQIRKKKQWEYMEDKDRGLWLPAVVVGHVGAYWIVEMRSVEEVCLVILNALPVGFS